MWRRGWKAAGVIVRSDRRFFGGEDASGGCGRGGWREFAEVARTSRSCSGVWLEMKTISVVQPGSAAIVMRCRS